MCGDSSVAEQASSQKQEGGSIPTSPLHSLRVWECPLQDIRSFIEEWHYSKSVNGLSARHCFKLMDKEKVVGAMIFGRMSMVNQWKKYAGKEADVIELRRLCCIDDTPKNTESWFIGKCVKRLRVRGYRVIVSYADPTHGHQGTIYRASNFKFVGRTSPGKVILFQGKTYHDHAIRTKYNGQLKPFALRLKHAIEKGEATYKKTEGKYIYTYEIRNRVEVFDD